MQMNVHAAKSQLSKLIAAAEAGEDVVIARKGRPAVRLDTFPSSSAAVASAQPVYEELPGWRTDTSHCRNFDDLPSNAQTYVRRIEELIGAPAALVSVGPERDQAIIVDPIL